MNRGNVETRGTRSPTDIDRTVRSNLRRLRLERNMTLQDLAAEIGISHQQIQKMKKG
jgi:DNA-binding XRE family transcriptional regulator